MTGEVHRVATGADHRADRPAPESAFGAGIAALLGIVPVIGLHEERTPERAIVQQRLGGRDERVPAEDEAHGCLHPGGGNGGIHRPQRFRRERDRLLDQDVFARLGCGDRLGRVAFVGGADRQGIQARMGQQCREVVVKADTVGVQAELAHLGGGMLFGAATEGHDLAMRIR
jgi:hypothetical protein